MTTNPFDPREEHTQFRNHMFVSSPTTLASYASHILDWIDKWEAESPNALIEMYDVRRSLKLFLTDEVSELEDDKFHQRKSYARNYQAAEYKLKGFADLFIRA